VQLVRAHTGAVVQQHVTSLISETLSHFGRHITIGVSGGSMVKLVANALIAAKRAK
jgi:6-phosphogluconolactonase/glucosamine-6-phosphate isomerase/deaminase